MPEWVKKLIKGPLAPIAARLFDAVAAWEHRWFDHKWKKAGESLPDEEEIDLMDDEGDDDVKEDDDAQ